MNSPYLHETAFDSTLNLTQAPGIVRPQETIFSFCLGLVTGGLGELGEAFDGNGIAIDRETGERSPAPRAFAVGRDNGSVRAEPALASMEGDGVAFSVMHGAVPFQGLLSLSPTHMPMRFF